MRFLFRAESAYPEHWKNKRKIIKAYFELCKVQNREPWFEPGEDITLSNFNMAIDRLEEAGVLK